MLTGSNVGCCMHINLREEEISLSSFGISLSDSSHYGEVKFGYFLQLILYDITMWFKSQLNVDMVVPNFI